MQQTMTTSRKIWLSLAILITGYFLSMLFGFFLSKQTETQLNDVSESLFPAATLSIEALNEFKHEVNDFSEAVLMGEESYFEKADEKSKNTIDRLTQINTLTTLDQNQKQQIEQVIEEIQNYTDEAMQVYRHATELVLAETFADSIAENAEFAQQMKNLADQAIRLTEKLDALTTSFRQSLKDELNSVSKATARQVWINIFVFMAVVLVSLTLIKLILSRATQEVLERDRAEADLRQLNEELEQRVKDRTADLAKANDEIHALNQMLKQENLRMSAELDITRRLQQMVLPRKEELLAIKGLDIACFMEPADEVGGDYYDVLLHDGHQLKIGIGDVTGHGLESGVFMIMVQTAVRTLLTSGITDPKEFMTILNRTIFDNVQRMNLSKMMSIALLDYAKGMIKVSGYHEEVIVVRKNGQITCLETNGMWLGIESDIRPYLPAAELEISLEPGDGIVLYSDGITEAHAEGSVPEPHNLYGINRLCEVISHNWDKSSNEIKQAVIDDVRKHVGEKSKLYDDLTLVVLKQK